jgi:NADH:ubiquinone oxidoreductase subunit 4 (subunit M)
MNIGISIILLGFLGIIGINSKDILTTIWVSPTKLIKQLSLILSIITLYIVLYWWYIYETNTNNYQLVSNIHNILLGLDSISLYLIVLTAIIILNKFII